ncbi:phosphoglycerate dehydrogenase [Weissella confusa]|uniref:Phosphoglycerate dehydrogenase n=1 Tax=Weissella confusa TaxID=1583 RepID=A0AAJ3DBS9_WEICO|nr:NAD(P)-dependent oxidoreductase [Weissella confusa]MBJ7694906.1 phosphoglycerate dehydrogenase [Weissella confusa]NBA12526.1 phosphoglycerate dehydrogenase [Weissella confusa]QBZ04223.1 phosphoglycerate dehydrogenase [Weissella confusa]
MSQLLLAVQPLRDADIAQLTELGVTVTTPETISDDILANVTISYGWSATLGPKILAMPNNQLKWIQTMSAGVDYMPLKDLSEQGILLTNASGLKSVPIAQSTVGYMMHFARGLNVYQNRNHWEEFTDQYMLSELPTVIFGTGHIGQQIARYLSAFDTPVYGVNTSGRPVDGFDATFSIDDLSSLPDVAVVISVLPGTDATKHFFNAETFAHFKNLFLFVNVGRGSTVDQAALLDALDNQNIRYAALDVTEVEPIPDDSPLWHHENLLLTQHTTWAEHESSGRAGNLFPLFMKNLPDFLAGQPLTTNFVDVTRGY